MDKFEFMLNLSVLDKRGSFCVPTGVLILTKHSDELGFGFME